MATYKFWKLGGGFKYQVDTLNSFAFCNDTKCKAIVSAGGTQIDIEVSNYSFSIRSTDAIQIEGVTATGTMEEKRDRLINEVLSNQYISA